MPKPWERYAKPQTGAAPAEAAPEGPWSKYQAKPAESEPGIMARAGQAALEGVAAVGEAVDRYTGAPTRAAISRLQRDGSPRRAIQAFGGQFGEDPGLAPTGQDIAVQAGIPDQTYQFQGKEPSPSDPDFHRYMNDPMFREEYLRSGKGSTYEINPSRLAGLAVDVAADPAAVLPVGAAAKATAGVAAKSAKAVGGAARATGEAVGKVATTVTKKVGNMLSGVPEKEIETYIRNYPEVKKLIQQYGDDMPGAADKIREHFQSTIRMRRQSLGAEVGRALDALPAERVVDIKPVVSELEKIKGRMNQSLRFEEVRQVDDLIERIGSLAGEGGKVTPKEMFDIKQFLQDRGSGAFMKDGQIFVPGKDAQVAAKNASREARKLVNQMSPSVAEANKELSKLHVMEKRINKSLLAPGKPEGALAAAGSGSNVKAAKDLERLGEVAGADFLGEAQKFSTARRFSDPGLTPVDTTGKSAYRMGKAALVGLGVGGMPGAIVAASLTSPLALKTAIQAGRVPVEAVKKAAGLTGKLTDAGIDTAYAVLKTERGQRAFQAALQGAKLESIEGRAGARMLRDVAEDEDGKASRKPSGGPDRWARTGAEKLGISASERDSLMRSKKGKQLLIEASDLKPGSKRFKKIQEEIKKERGQR